MDVLWSTIQTDWHKILVVILAIASAWKFFFQYIRPMKSNKTAQPINIILPKEGCSITVKPLPPEIK